MGTLTAVTRFLIFYVFVQGMTSQTDFLICPNPTPQGTPVSRKIDCGADTVIDFIYARAVYLGVSAPCDDEKGNINYINDNWGTLRCKVELELLECYGHRTCVVNQSVGTYCKGSTQIDVLLVQYTCYKFSVDGSTVVELPTNQILTGNRIDVLSPNFPDKIPKEEYNTTCTITPLVKVPNTIVQLYVKTKLISYDGTIGIANLDKKCTEIVSLEQEEKNDTRLVCNNGTLIATRQHEEDSNPTSGTQWKIHYQRLDETVEQGKFWIEFKATAGNAPVDLEIACENHLAPAVPWKDKSEGEKTSAGIPIMWVIIGVVSFVALVLLIILVVFCLRRRRKQKREDKKSPTDTSAPKEGAGVYCIAGAIDGEANGNLKNENDNKTKKPNTYVNVEQPKVEYAEINVKKKSKKTDKGLGDEVKKAVDDETIMYENDTLYSSAKDKNLGKVDYAEIKFPDSPIKGKGNGDKTGDAPYNDVL